MRGWKARRIIFTPVWLKTICAEIESEDEHLVPVTDAFPGLDGGVGEMGIPQVVPNTIDEPLPAAQDLEPAAAAAAAVVVEEEELNSGAAEGTHM